MPYCPNCNFEYRPGTPRCPDCSHDLVEGSPPPPQPAPPPPDTEAVRLCRVSEPIEADIIHAALAEVGIPSVINTYGPITGAYLARVVDGATHDYALIFVPRNRLAEARQILAEIETGPTVWPEGMEPQDEEDPAD